MATTLLPLTFSLLFLISLLTTVTSITDPELQPMLSALRSSGYNLFGNAITTSDIRYELLSGSSFTFFAPTDGSLFALDMTAPASLYVSSLRYHIVHRRLSVSDLQRLRSGSNLSTLLLEHEVIIGRARSPDSNNDSDVITVDDVDVVFPGLYYGKNIAVHGLNGILDYRSRDKSVYRTEPAKTNELLISSESHGSHETEPPRTSELSIPPESYNEESTFMTPEYANPENLAAAAPLSYSSVSPVEIPSPNGVFDGDSDSDLAVDPDSDPGGDYGNLQPSPNGDAQCDEAKCGEVEDNSWVIEGAALAQESFTASVGKRKDGLEENRRLRSPSSSAGKKRDGKREKNRRKGSFSSSNGKVMDGRDL